MKFFIFLFFVTISFSNLKASSFDLSFSGTFKTLVVDSKFTKAQKTMTELSPRFFYSISNSLNFIFDGVFEFESGSFSTAYVSDFENKNSFFLKNAYLEYSSKKNKKFTLKLGAQSLKDYNSPLLFRNYSFFSLSEKVQLKHFYFKLMQSIPEQRKKTQRLSPLEGSISSVFIETLGLKLNSKAVKGRIELSRFDFFRISNSVFFESYYRGNTATPIGTNEASNDYDYKGYNLMTYFETLFKSFKMSFMLEYLLNEKAPKNRDTGYLIEIGVKKPKNHWKLGHFLNESDSSIAWYNSKEFGHNNVKGFYISHIYTFKNNNSFKSSVYKSSPIFNTPYQSEMTIFLAALTHHF